VRLKDICGEEGSKCPNAVPGPWQRIQQAAEDASVWRTIAQITVSHLDTAMSLVAGLSTGDGRARVAMALHRLASLDGVTGTNSAVVSVSQQELGAMTRLSRNAIRPVIAELEKAGLAIPRYRRIVIPDLAALARFAAAASPDRTGAAR
jgi:CRP-like cAMP-binding protein